MIGAATVVAACSLFASAQADATTLSAAASRKSLGCTNPKSGAVMDRIDLDVAGTPRSSLVHLPTGWDGKTPIPVVVSFHGAGFDGSVMQLQDGLNAKADEERFVVLHPDGLRVDLSGNVKNITGWDLGKNSKDAAFVKALLDDLGQRVCIDPARVFATGISNGAEMAMAIACAAPTRIAAYAAVANGREVPCSSRKPTPALAFHGLDDKIVPYNGAADRAVLSAEDLMRDQAERNRCSTSAPKARHVTANTERLMWTGCTASTVLYRLDSHGHAWPGIPVPFPRALVVASFTPGGGANPTAVAFGLTPDEAADNVLLTNTDINATDVMWQFFSRSA